MQVCNQTPPIGGQPSLMTFREVETLFHECGHALQHMLTQVQSSISPLAFEVLDRDALLYLVVKC
jgi:Zn-dependent oligopeptidase